MKCNLGKADRVIRAIVGVGVIAVGIYFQNWLGAIGAVLIFTSTVGWCPAYVPFGLRSCKK